MPMGIGKAVYNVDDEAENQAWDKWFMTFSSIERWWLWTSEEFSAGELYDQKYFLEM